MSKTVFSGIQPSGKLHLGNYLGAVRAWAELQHQYHALYALVDLHAMTTTRAPEQLRTNVFDLTASLLACGLDPERATIFVQSENADHTELHWYLCCVARMGWLSRMTQFKEKTGKNREQAAVGLYVYPILMAADILLYRADLVPVGDDQTQHLELARLIARRLNTEFLPTCAFPEPQKLSMGRGSRVMSLRDGQKKMSKSEPGQQGCLLIDDSDDALAHKIRKAKTDTQPLPSDVAGFSGRYEAQNLVEIYAALAQEDVGAVLSRFGGASFSQFKTELTDLVVDRWGAVRERYFALRAQPEYVASVLDAGARSARAQSRPVMALVRECFGSRS